MKSGCFFKKSHENKIIKLKEYCVQHLPSLEFQKVKQLIDEWPQSIYIEKEADPILQNVKRNQDGTFEIISEKPEVEKVDIE